MQQIKDFRDIIRQKPYLIWYTKNYDGLDETAVVEAVLNNGDWEELKDLIKILGREKVAGIFFEQVSHERCNYSPKRADFFKLYFAHDARRNIH